MTAKKQKASEIQAYANNKGSFNHFQRYFLKLFLKPAFDNEQSG